MKMISKSWLHLGLSLGLIGSALSCLSQAPVVVSVTPANNTTGVATNVTMVLRFSAPMAEENFFPGLTLTFQPPGPIAAPQWNSDSTEVSLPLVFGGYAPGIKYTWSLKPGGTIPGLPEFTSAAGVPVVATSGSFTTTGTGGGGGTVVTGECTPQDRFDPAVIAADESCPDPTDPDPDNLYGFVSVFRSLRFDQVAANDVRPAAEGPFAGSAGANGPKDNPFTAVSYSGPGQPTRVLTNGFGFYFHSREFATQAEMEKEFPVGNYSFALTQTTGGNRNVTVTLPSGIPTAMRISNFDDAQRIAPSQPFTFRWPAVVGAGTSDSLVFQIVEECTQRTVFIAPNPCVPLTLRSTDTSIIVPANTLLPGKRYEGRLNYSRFNGLSQVPKTLQTGAGVFTETMFPINNPGGSGGGASARITSFTVATGGYQLVATGTASKPYVIEVSPNLQTWTELVTKTADASGGLSHTIPAGGGDVRFFRVVSK